MSTASVEVARNATWASVLSQRELEVASLAASGLPNKEVARRLGVAQRTIKQHMHRIFRKLGARSRYSLILSKGQ
jgi:two-component system, NarL family, nitrate/nitrite response regulator NarL